MIFFSLIDVKETGDPIQPINREISKQAAILLYCDLLVFKEVVRTNLFNSVKLDLLTGLKCLTCYTGSTWFRPDRRHHVAAVIS